MKIYFLIKDIHLNGGGERVLVNLVNYFYRHFKVDVEIISMSPSKNETPYNLNKKIKINYINEKKYENTYIGKCIRVLSTYVKLKKFFIKQKIKGEYILGIGIYPSVFLGAINSLKIKKIGCEHSSYDSQPIHWRILRSIFYPRLSGIVSLTERDKNKLNKKFKNVVCIPNSRTFIPKNRAPLKNKLILAIGRFNYEKNWLDMIKIFKEVNKDYPDWKLKIIGEGPLKNEIVKKIKDEKLEKAIEIKGKTNEIMKEYLESSIYLLTSHYEGLPMVLIEAQACGVPIVSYDCETGPREIIKDNVDGYLVEHYNSKEMVEKILKLVKNEKLRKHMGKEGTLNSVKFSEEEIFEKWKKLISE